MSYPNASTLKALFSRLFGANVPANGAYVFNLKGRWRYENRARGASPRREWGGEAFGYAWLSRQAQSREPTTPAKPDPQILALIRH